MKAIGYKVKHGGTITSSKGFKHEKGMLERLTEVTPLELILTFIEPMTIDQALEYSQVPFNDLILIK